MSMWFFSISYFLTKNFYLAETSYIFICFSGVCRSSLKLFYNSYLTYLSATYLHISAFPEPGCVSCLFFIQVEIFLSVCLRSDI